MQNLILLWHSVTSAPTINLAASFQDFVCPQCLDGFIEELPESSSNQSADEQDESQFMRGVFNDFSMGPFHMSSGNNNTPYFRIANEILAPIITGSLGGLASTSR